MGDKNLLIGNQKNRKLNHVNQQLRNLNRKPKPRNRQPQPNRKLKPVNRKLKQANRKLKPENRKLNQLNQSEWATRHLFFIDRSGLQGLSFNVFYTTAVLIRYEAKLKLISHSTKWSEGVADLVS